MTVGDLVIDIVELRRHTGTRRELARTVQLDDLAVGDTSVVNGHLDLDLVVEAATEGIVAYGTMGLVVRGPCRRCLSDVDTPVEVALQEVFEAHPTEGETWPIDDERIDLAPVVREAALLSFPLVPLCADDCAGPEPERFPTGPAEEAESARDPRWAALDDLDLT